MSELARVLDMYRRRGFDALSEQERHVLSELMLGALVDVQESLREIKEALRLLTGLTSDVQALKTWRAEVGGDLDDVFEERREYHEGAQKVKWGLIERVIAGAIAVALVGLLTYLAMGIEARSAPRVHPAAPPQPVEVPRYFEDEVQYGQQREDDRRVHTGARRRADVLGRAGHPLLYTRQQLGLAAGDLRRLVVEAPDTRPAFRFVKEREPFGGVYGRRGPAHPEQEAGRGGVGEQGPVGESIPVGVDGAGGVAESPPDEGPAGKDEGGDGVRVGRSPLKEPVACWIETHRCRSVVALHPRAGERVGRSPFPPGDEFVERSGRIIDGLPVLGGRGAASRDAEQGGRS
jgi:hypothetical protein